MISRPYSPASSVRPREGRKFDAREHPQRPISPSRYIEDASSPSELANLDAPNPPPQPFLCRDQEYLKATPHTHHYVKRSHYSIPRQICGNHFQFFSPHPTASLSSLNQLLRSQSRSSPYQCYQTGDR